MYCVTYDNESYQHERILLRDVIPHRLWLIFQLKMVLIKCCDISNEVRPFEVSEPWVDCLLEEYFNQVCVSLWCKHLRENLQIYIAVFQCSVNGVRRFI